VTCRGRVFNIARLLGSVLVLEACAVSPHRSAVSVRPPCHCDHEVLASLTTRECSLCQVASQHTEAIFVLKDNDPRKPNRWLVLPSRHETPGIQLLRSLERAERNEFLLAAVREAEKRFPDGWGIAINEDSERTQCHLHVHLGPARRGIACPRAGASRTDASTLLDGIDLDGEIWIHSDGGGGGYHVHTTVTAESVLEP